MKDALGQEITIGCQVLISTGNRARFARRTVTGIGPKMVRCGKRNFKPETMIVAGIPLEGPPYNKKTKKLFRVQSLQTEMIMAESAEDAIFFFTENQEEMSGYGGGAYYMAMETYECSNTGYDKDSIPWNGDDESTIREIENQNL